MTRQEVLAQVEEIGRTLAKFAEPSYWSYEQRERASKYTSQLESARRCWKEIKAGNDMVKSLEGLAKVVFGIEGNHVRLLINELQK